jgi:hypothetical protein
LANHAARERKGWLSVTRDQQPSGVRNDRNMGRYKKRVFQFQNYDSQARVINAIGEKRQQV